MLPLPVGIIDAVPVAVLLKVSVALDVSAMLAVGERELLADCEGDDVGAS